MPAYELLGSGTFTILAPLATGAYSFMPEPRFDGPLFGNQYVEGVRYINTISLVGRSAGDVLPLHLLGDGAYSPIEPVLDVRAFSGAVVDTAGGFNTRVNITLTPTTTAPEPASLALVAVGITVGSLVVRRRRSA